VTGYLQPRLDALRKYQNPDGGWGYFPGRQSWMEPTAWAAIALHKESPELALKAWKLMRSWQNEDGSCRPCAAVPVPNWTAALALIHASLQKDDTAVRRGVSYLLETAGEDSTWLARVAKLLSPSHTDRNPKFKGWPWRPGNAAWVEPTAHSITALRLAGRIVGEDKVRARIESAQSMILHQRCQDGGWNYGATFALGHHLASFPETTGLALIGLAGGQAAQRAEGALAHAGNLLQTKLSPLSQAWLRLALSMHGKQVPEPASGPVSNDILLTAIESVDWKVLA
jgi:hypothetical protein